MDKTGSHPQSFDARRQGHGIRYDDEGEVGLGPGLAAVLLLSTLAGAVDAYGLSILGDVFVSFMSGNTTSLGLAIGRGDLSRAALIAGIIGTFTTGAVAGGLLSIGLGRFRLPGIVAVAAAMLVLPIALPATSVHAMTFAMGVLNAALDHAGRVGVSLTYITGSLVKFGRGLAAWLCGQETGLDWLQQVTPWLGILGGALAAAACIGRYGEASFAAVPAVALLVSLLLLMIVFRSTAARS